MCISITIYKGIRNNNILGGIHAVLSIENKTSFTCVCRLTRSDKSALYPIMPPSTPTYDIGWILQANTPYRDLENINVFVDQFFTWIEAIANE